MLYGSFYKLKKEGKAVSWIAYSKWSTFFVKSSKNYNKMGKHIKKLWISTTKSKKFILSQRLNTR
jgi:hypothetical protein